MAAIFWRDGFSMQEGVYVTIANPAFCLLLYLTGAHLRGKLQHGSDVSQQKIKSRPIRTWEIGGVALSGELYRNWWEILKHWIYIIGKSL